ncbi:MAG TPA: hypothetical protein HPQ00_05855 [Magnetococcales bacterium]|nr:hypothetical protein [Magnetococcales bacterium]
MTLSGVFEKEARQLLDYCGIRDYTRWVYVKLTTRHTAVFVGPGAPVPWYKGGGWTYGKQPTRRWPNRN